VGIQVDIARGENEAPAELEGVLAGSMLPVAGRPRPGPGGGVVTAEEMQQGAHPKARGAICLPPLVDQEGELDATLLAKEARVVPIPEPDGGDLRPRAPEGLLVLAQLRDVLAAEDSAVVTEERQDCRALLPQGAQPDLVSIGVG